MKTQLLIFSLTIFSILNTQAQATDSLELGNEEELNLDFEKLDGTIDFVEANAKINVPKGFKFIGKKDAKTILTDLWGNPEDETVFGLLVPDNFEIFGTTSWAYTITYEQMGYVKDEDAEDIDYSDLLKEQQKETLEANIERKKLGYEEFFLLGWASKPFYDKDRKVLHWAKELKFGTDSITTLNYNLRVLGRKGVILLNAVATMEDLPMIKSNVNAVLESFSYNEGFKYKDFDSKVDDVAAWTVGGLVAGKVLAKVGFWALIVKFWKFIAIGAIALFAGIKKFFFKSKNNEENETQNEDLNTNKDN